MTKHDLLEHLAAVGSADAMSVADGFSITYPASAMALLRLTHAVTPDNPLFWSTWGRRSGAKTRAPMAGQNVWRLCKVYGRLIGYPMLKPHDLRHGVALDVLEQHHDLEQVRALLGHARLDTTQIYTTIRPPQLKRAVAFYEEKAQQMLKQS